MLARAQKSIELYLRADAPPQIVPLLSQPVVELCLSIPTWQWVHGGRGRAVARAAVAGILPDLLVERTTKGSPSGFVRRVYAAQGNAAREMLTDGKLVDRKSTRLNSSHSCAPRMQSSACNTKNYNNRSKESTQNTTRQS